MIAMAITQIHTHRRNGHGSWRDGVGDRRSTSRALLDLTASGAADASGGNGEQQTLRNAFLERYVVVTGRTRSAGGCQQRQRQRSQDCATPNSLPHQHSVVSHARRLG